MSKEQRTVKYSEVTKILKRNGCRLIKHGTNHDMWYSEKKTKDMKVRAIIEVGKNPAFDIMMEYREDLPFGLLGQGETIEQAKADFMNSYREMSALLEEQGKKVPALEFEYVVDTASFLRYVSGVFTMSGLEKITGINRKQLGHYIQGVSKPRPQTAERIQQGILKYQQELSNLHFA